MISGEAGWGIYSGDCLTRAEWTWQTGRADVADDACTERTGRHADRPTRRRHADGQKRHKRGPRGADRAQYTRTGGRAD